MHTKNLSDRLPEIKDYYLPEVESVLNSCFCCTAWGKSICDEDEIAVGFGSAYLTKDGDVVYAENMNDDEQDHLTVGAATELVKADPEHDWMICLNAALKDRTYQWQGSRWVLVEAGLGFA